MCTPYLVSIISTYSIAISLCKDWRETQCAEHTLAELLYMSRAGIGPQLCHSNSKYSPTSSVLLSWCSPRRGGEWIFSVWLAGAPSACSLPPVLDLLSSYEAEWKPCSLPPLLWLRSVCVCVSSWHFLFSFQSLILCGAVSFYLWCFSGVARRGTFVLGRRSSDGRQCWLWLGLGMLNGGREGLFELGQQLQQQGEYQAALHCFLSCLLGLTHVQSFTSLPNCLHQVTHTLPFFHLHTHTHTHTHTHIHTHTNMHVHIQHMQPHNLLYHVFAQLSRHICISSPVEHHSLSHRTTLISMTTMSSLTVHHVFLCWHCVIISVSVVLIVCMLAERHNRCSCE